MLVKVTLEKKQFNLSMQHNSLFWFVAMQIKQEKLKVNQMKASIKNIVYSFMLKTRLAFLFLLEGKRSTFKIIEVSDQLSLSASPH